MNLKDKVKEAINIAFQAVNESHLGPFPKSEYGVGMSQIQANAFMTALQCICPKEIGELKLKEPREPWQDPEEKQ